MQSQTANRNDAPLRHESETVHPNVELVIVTTGVRDTNSSDLQYYCKKRSAVLFLYTHHGSGYDPDR